MSLYSRRNAAPEAPGQWISGDGEYEFTHAGKVWTAHHRAHWNEATRSFETLAIGTGPTLNSVFALASRHYVTPVGQWEAQS